MDSIYESAVKTGKAEGKAEMFLVFARRKFRRVSPEWEAQVKSAAPEQLDDWLLQAYDTDDLESVFSGSSPASVAKRY